MKRILSLILIVLLFLCGCDNKIYYWTFEYDISNVKEIYIVETDGGYRCEILKELSDELFEPLCQEISDLEMKRYGPSLYDLHGKCFMVVFENGNYDIISQTESKRFRYDEVKLMSYNSWLQCDETQFEKLMQKYWLLGEDVTAEQ